MASGKGGLTIFRNLLFTVCFAVSFIVINTDIPEESILGDYLNTFNDELTQLTWKLQTLRWRYSTNMTESNARALNIFEEKNSIWMDRWKRWARSVDSQQVQSPSYKRMLKLMAAGVVCRDPRDARLVSELRSSLASIYASGSVMVSEVHNDSVRLLEGEDAVNSFMAANLGRPDVLAGVWQQWQKAVGRRSRQPFQRLAAILQKCSRENGFKNYGEAWMSELEIPHVVDVALNLWKQVEDLYRQLHAYVHRKLLQIYGTEAFGNSNSIPVHLLGSLWGYNWQGLTEILLPYPESFPLPERSSPLTSVQNVERFFLSMDLPPMSPSFWQNSQFQRPSDGRVADCHSAAFDFALHDDFRLRLCSNGSPEEESTVFHEMGHVMYFMAYRHQPMIFRNGANSAFHEAVGDAIADGVAPCSLPEKGSQPTSNDELNLLMRQALTKVAILPWALTLDLWRYQIFSGQTEQLNEHWWLLRELFQGVRPPDVPEYRDFDPGTKYHIVNFMPYMRYYFSHFLEFQFLDSLCDKSLPLHRCCLAGNVQAGHKLWSMLSLGGSQPWPVALKELTNTSSILATPLLQYFSPLYTWLKEQNDFQP